MIDFKNIRNVRLFNEDVEAYLCELDLKIEDEPWESVEYCAREGGGGICDEVVAEIRKGNFKGELKDGSPTVEDYRDDLRAARNDILAKTDLMVLPDRWAAMSEARQKEWAEYRQALRDLPNTCTDPRNPCWPREPRPNV